MCGHCFDVNLADFEQMINNFIQLGVEWFNDINCFHRVKEIRNYFCVTFLTACT